MRDRSSEKLVFEAFQKLYRSLPNGSINYTERPDVLYSTTEGKLIGIEITEAYHNPDGKRVHNFTTKFNKDLLEKVIKKLPFKFDLSVEFVADLGSSKVIKQKPVQNLLEIVCGIIIRNFYDLKNNETRYIENYNDDTGSKIDNHLKVILKREGFINMPPMIVGISMTRCDNLIKSHHFESNVGVLP